MKARYKMHRKQNAGHKLLQQPLTIKKNVPDCTGYCILKKETCFKNNTSKNNKKKIRVSSSRRGSIYPRISHREIFSTFPSILK